jgi:methylmalonyl-CoA mutase N-terminal domain/subunit
MRIVTDIFAFCRDQAPAWNAISISGYHLREAGSTAAQEVAFTIANGIAYVEAARARGLEPDTIGPHLSFFLSAHNDLLEEVAKFRAARRLWARTMRERFGARDPRAQVFRFHVQTAGSTLAAQQPDVNVVRVTLQALAAALGGAQSLHTNSRDEALALPTEASALLALRTQQILAFESGAPSTVDPLAGAYAIEKLTNEMESRAAEYIAKIDALGGAPRAIEQGFVQREIQQAAYEDQKAVDAGERVIVGVNRYRSDAPAPLAIHRIPPEVERGQVERLRALRARRDAGTVAAALREVEETARSDRNLMPAILDAVRTYATVGEISNALRNVFGEYQESVVI